MINDDIISDARQVGVPWYAAWDLAFHTVASASSTDFARSSSS
jgi:hypothetical protein